MSDFYKIDTSLLDSVSSNLSTEKTSFTEGASKIFSTSYLSKCDDSTIQSMYRKINDHYSKIAKSYNSINTWLSEYSNDVKNVDSSLSYGGYNIKDSSTSQKVDQTLTYKEAEIEEAPDMVDDIKNGKTHRRLKEAEEASKKVNLPYDTNSENDYETLPYDTSSTGTIELYAQRYDEKGNPINSDKTMEIKDRLKEYEKTRLELKKDVDALEEWYETTGKDLKEVEGLEDSLNEHGPLTEEDEYKNLSTNQKKYLLMLVKQSELAYLNEAILDAQYELNIEAYIELTYTDEYKDYIKNFSVDAEYDKLLAWEEENGVYGQYLNDVDKSILYDYSIAHNLETDETSGLYYIKIGELGAEIEYRTFYKYTTEEQRSMYHYLYAKKGADAANKYVTLLLSKINKQAGYDLAKETMKDVDYYYSGAGDESWVYSSLSFLATMWKTTTNAIENGLGSFCDDIDSCVVSKKLMTVDQWKRYYEGDYFRKIGFGFYYEFIQGIAKNLPATALGAMSSGVISTTMFTMETWGSTHDAALQSGMSEEDAFWYATAMSGKDLAVNFIMNKIPGLDAESVAKSFAKGLTKEVISDGMKNFYEHGVNCMLNGEKWDMGEITEDAFHSMLYSACSYALSNSKFDMGIANDFVVSCVVDGKEYNIKGKEELEKVLKEQGMLPEGFSFDDVTDFDRNVVSADTLADQRMMTEVKIDDIRDVTPEKLEGIKNKDKMLFVLPDGKMLSYEELKQTVEKNEQMKEKIPKYSVDQINTEIDKLAKEYPEYASNFNSIKSDLNSGKIDINEANKKLSLAKYAVQHGDESWSTLPTTDLNKASANGTKPAAGGGSVDEIMVQKKELDEKTKNSKSTIPSLKGAHVSKQ